jgi:hypothetical protein
MPSEEVRRRCHHLLPVQRRSCFQRSVHLSNEGFENASEGFDTEYKKEREYGKVKEYE